MKAEQTKIQGCWRLIPTVFSDHRGYFYESFQEQHFQKITKVKFNPVQDNHAHSTYGVIRGLHFQEAPYEQAKLVQALKGTILDVVLDLRKESKTFGEVVRVKLSQENKEQLFIPKGCAHGYAVLSSDATVFYKTDVYYHPEAEQGILYNDPDLNIDWGIPKQDQLLSEKDNSWNGFKKYSS